MARPVVASRVGGIPEAVRDGVEGLLVPPGDALALAAAVCRLLTDAALAQEMGQRGRQRVLERFTFQENVRALVAWHAAWAAHA
jgi:glycosyltransferase involved in cell wall biosynthesis